VTEADVPAGCSEEWVGPCTKGLRLTLAMPLAALRADLANHPRRIDDPLFSLPLLMLDDDALAHNIATMAQACERYGVRHAPHVKTTMSADLWRRQEQAGAWAATVATATQLRVVRAWGAKRILLANELVDVRDMTALAQDMADDPEFQIWMEVDSTVGVDVLAGVFEHADPQVTRRMHPLVELGVKGGRTGTRAMQEAVVVASRLLDRGLSVAGVAGYEGPIADDASPESLAAVAEWLDSFIDAVGVVADVSGHWQDAVNGKAPQDPAEGFVVTVGGSAYLDVVLPVLGRCGERGWTAVVRSGSYVTHDHGHYAEVNPWSRLPGDEELWPALTIGTTVLSTPEPHLALLGLGRRDTSFDAGLPRPLCWRRPGVEGRLGPAQPFGDRARVRELNDQHAFLDLGDERITPGNLVTVGVSHPCTTFDKWRIAALVRGDEIIDLYPLDF